MLTRTLEEGIEQCRLFHQSNKTFGGTGTLKHWKRLRDLVAEHNCTTALDFGCGKGNQYRAMVYTDDGPRDLVNVLGVEITPYDPAVPEFNMKPKGKFDLVWCIDVLAIVPADAIPQVIDQLYSHARKVLFVAIAMFECQKTFANGDNIHLTIKPSQWWREQFGAGAARASKNGRVAELVLDIG